MINSIRSGFLGALVVALGLASSAASPAPLLADIKLEVNLSAVSAGALQSGKAKFESRSDRRRFSCEVEDVSGSGLLDVQVNGSSVGTITLDMSGGGDLNLDDRDGDPVPLGVMAGSTIKVFQGGTEILSGSF